MNMNANQILVFFSVKYNGDLNRITRALKERETISEEAAAKAEKEVLENSQYLTLLDHNFPPKLKSVNNPPVVLYYEGNRNLFKTITTDNKVLISATGTIQEPTKYGKQAMSKIMSGLSKDSIIIVGEQEGMNLEIVKEALKAKLKIILVLNRGLKATITPGYEKLREHILSNKGLIISQFPYQSEVEGIEHTNFPLQNQLVAVLGNTLWITESYKYKAKTHTKDYQVNNTLAFALECGNTVACIPYPITASDSNIMNNQYIMGGADLIETGKQLNALSK
jgi:DNA processing protein